MNKALTVKHPWAASIIHLGKDVENRTRPTKYRGQLFIHAAKTHSQEGIDFLRRRGIQRMPTLATLGMVIGTVDVVGCHHASECDADTELGACSDWALPDHYHWVLANPRPLACPFPETGKLGLWNLGDS